MGASGMNLRNRKQKGLSAGPGRFTSRRASVGSRGQPDRTSGREGQVALHLVQSQPQPQPARPKLIIEGVSKRFLSKRATVEALENVSLAVLEG